MTVYLSAQQSRLGQISGRLDKAHADVVAASAEAQSVNTRFNEFQAAMDTFVDSSWYFARFTDPWIKTSPTERKTVDEWLPVDQYIGGIEHG